MAIKSRPVYAGFNVDITAQQHVLALEGQGADALLEKLAEGHPMLERAEILYVATGSDHDVALRALGAANYWLAPTAEALRDRLSEILAHATMCTRLYVAGTEGFIGSIVQLAADFGIANASIIKEFRGSQQRRVQCVHCKGFNDNVTISPFQCVHCDLHLFVRDHFSVRLNAFQGVCINAETPDIIPPSVEMYR